MKDTSLNWKEVNCILILLFTVGVGVTGTSILLGTNKDPIQQPEQIDYNRQLDRIEQKIDKLIRQERW